jgi:hypothetical protein
VIELFLIWSIYLAAAIVFALLPVLIIGMFEEQGSGE